VQLLCSVVELKMGKSRELYRELEKRRRVAKRIAGWSGSLEPRRYRDESFADRPPEFSLS
jgi:hypothetical protein